MRGWGKDKDMGQSPSKSNQKSIFEEGFEGLERSIEGGETSVVRSLLLAEPFNQRRSDPPER